MIITVSQVCGQVTFKQGLFSGVFHYATGFIEANFGCTEANAQIFTRTKFFETVGALLRAY